MRVLQIYRDGSLINQDTESTAQCPPIIEYDLDPGNYEVKLFVPEETYPEISVWIEVVDEISYDCDEPDLTGIPDNQIVNMMDFTSGNQVTSPVFFTWNSEDNEEFPERVFQIYRDGSLINHETEHTARCPYIKYELAPGNYEIKLWIPGGFSPEISLWIEVVEGISSIYSDSTQIDSSWMTVPGDGCLPMIPNYQQNYDQYTSINNTNLNFSQLIANAHALSSNNQNAGNSPYIIHNITYTQEINQHIAEGTHTASYSFQIPSFSTGITVEGGLFIWIGDDNVRLDYGTAFQLIVDQDNINFGNLYYWGGSEWIDSGEKIELQHNTFYTVAFNVNIDDHAATIFLQGNGILHIIDHTFSETEKADDWTTDSVARLQVECISKDSMRHVVNVRDLYWQHLY
jgi:hypothetical protein